MHKILNLNDKQDILNLKNEISSINHNVYFETGKVTDLRNIEYRLVKAHGLRKKIENNFSQYLENIGKKLSVSFWNKSKDTYLVIPTKPYAHISSFAKKGTDKEWLAVFNKIKRYIDENEYISTHGHGVAYVHFRIEKYPKYYVW